MPDVSEQQARLAALILALRQGGMQTMPNGNPAALGMALQGGQMPPAQPRPNYGLGNINGTPVPNPNPVPLQTPIIGTRG